MNNNFPFSAYNIAPSLSHWINKCLIWKMGKVIYFIKTLQLYLVLDGKKGELAGLVQYPLMTKVFLCHCVEKPESGPMWIILEITLLN